MVSGRWKRKAFPVTGNSTFGSDRSEAFENLVQSTLSTGRGPVLFPVPSWGEPHAGDLSLSPQTSSSLPPVSAYFPILLAGLPVCGLVHHEL